jgi:hypothetical protein
LKKAWRTLEKVFILLEDFEEPRTLIFLQGHVFSTLGLDFLLRFMFFSALARTNDNNLLQFCNKVDFFDLPFQ